MADLVIVNAGQHCWGVERERLFAALKQLGWRKRLDRWYAPLKPRAKPITAARSFGASANCGHRRPISRNEARRKRRSRNSLASCPTTSRGFTRNKQRAETRRRLKSVFVNERPILTR